MEAYSVYGNIIAQEGKVEELQGYLLEAAESMKDVAGCYTYLVGRNPEEANAVYVLEVWENKEAHQASLQLDHVRQLIEKAKPIIAGMNSQPDLNIIGGHLKF
ncbi:putative quinol monooxygenase [Streptococcus oricebi]|uniref:Antibiotic biosynthesis monooxygenase n=1 Tax=Streptococcus oricebi TaxID=1547447 RepID=A0ABS5B0R8_9STRE|nr:putative quinol monooxygenase [Streptococcus oricebi]MBP2622355.1 antibiotic biosynthesis monooxygenase [Streptococcus oricebi]